MTSPYEERYDEPERGEKPPNPEHVRKAKMHEASKRHPDCESLPFQIGDPVMDAAQGRPMVVLDTPMQTVEEWSEENGYDLTENYGNQKLGVEPDEPVVVTRYVSDVSGDHTKTYTFPQSRLRLIDVHHADDGRRVYDRVAVDVLAGLFEALTRDDASHLFGVPDSVERVAEATGVEEDAVVEAMELGEIEARFAEEPTEAVE